MALSDSDVCSRCGSRRPRFRARDDQHTEVLFCSSVCHANFYGTFLADGMQFRAGALLEIPSWAVNLRRINLSSSYHGTWHSHDEIRGKLDDAGSDPGVLAEFDAGATTYVSGRRKFIEAFLGRDPTSYDTDGKKINEWVDYAEGVNMVHRGLVIPSLPDDLYKEFAEFVRTSATKMVDQSRSDRYTTVHSIFRRILGDMRLLIATGEVTSEMIQHFTRLFDDSDAVPLYQREALSYLSRRYHAQANAFRRKAEVLLKTVRVFGGVHLFKGKSAEKSFRLDIEKTSVRFPFWVAFEAESALSYVVGDEPEFLEDVCEGMGQIGVYEVLREVELPDMSNVAVVRRIRQEIEASPDHTRVLSLFNRGFQIKRHDNLGHEYVSRTSEFVADRIVAEWLCEHGYEGFAWAEVEGLLPEIMFCEPVKHMHLVRKINAREELELRFCRSMFVRQNPRLVYEAGW